MGNIQKTGTAFTQPGGSSEGHRERLRQRFLAGDRAALSEEALLELLLSYAIVRRDVQPLAKSLLTRFGNLNAVLAADAAALSQVSGVKDTTIALLKLARHFRKAADCPTAEPSSSLKDSPPPGSKLAALAKPSPADPPTAPQSPGQPRANAERKLQVSNGYSLDAAQLARLLSFIQSRPSARKITSAQLIEGSGLSARQVENLVSMGTALGLVTPRTQLLAPFGKLVAKHDIFLDSITTLEFCHFLAAGSARHLVWFEVFNDLLATQRPMAQPAWSAWLRQQLAGQYSEASLTKHVAHEVRFILDAYLVRNFKKLNLLTETPEKTYAVRRYSSLQPLTLAAMIYAVGARSGARVVPFADLHGQPGSPGRIFALDSVTLRQMVETLHQREWVRFEVRHGLDQIRLIEGFEPLEFIAAAYENRVPRLQDKPRPPATTPLLF
jgi:hypothetical protein